VAGQVVSEQDVEPRRAPGDTAACRDTLPTPHLRQSIVRFAPGRSRQRATGACDEVLFVLSGRGTLLLDGAAHELEPETGAYLAPGDTYEIENPGPDELAVVSVLVPDPPRPAEDPSAEDPAPSRRVAVRLGDQQAQAATTDREFRIVCDPGIGCSSVTQFVGEIPAARAPEHYHRYDEVIYVLDGEGVVQIGDLQARLCPGTCVHLPAETLHCLTNTGAGVMRVLGVFRPAGSPAAAYYPDGTLAYRGGGGTS
jgi:mannose-6-phosphate isomerase-like protein (cupin superfamily)